MSKQTDPGSENEDYSLDPSMPEEPEGETWNDYQEDAHEENDQDQQDEEEAEYAEETGEGAQEYEAENPDEEEGGDYVEDEENILDEPEEVVVKEKDLQERTSVKSNSTDQGEVPEGKVKLMSKLKFFEALLQNAESYTDSINRARQTLDTVSPEEKRKYSDLRKAAGNQNGGRATSGSSYGLSNLSGYKSSAGGGAQGGKQSGGRSYWAGSKGYEANPKGAPTGQIRGYPGSRKEDAISGTYSYKPARAKEVIARRPPEPLGGGAAGGYVPGGSSGTRSPMSGAPGLDDMRHHTFAMKFGDETAGPVYLTGNDDEIIRDDDGNAIDLSACEFISDCPRGDLARDPQRYAFMCLKQEVVNLNGKPTVRRIYRVYDKFAAPPQQQRQTVLFPRPTLLPRQTIIPMNIPMVHPPDLRTRYAHVPAGYPQAPNPTLSPASLSPASSPSGLSPTSSGRASLYMQQNYYGGVHNPLGGQHTPVRNTGIYPQQAAGRPSAYPQPAAGRPSAYPQR